MNLQNREMAIHYIREARRIAEQEKDEMLCYILDLALEEADRSAAFKAKQAPRHQ